MANYKEMYLSLFNDVSDVIEHLQKAQLKTEEMFMNSGDAPPIHLGGSNDGNINRDGED